MSKPRILIISPFRNEEHSVPHYLKALHEIEYPHELIDVYWLENDSSDGTLQILREHQHDYDFNSLTLNPVMILGLVEKKPSGEYWKDLTYGSPRVDAWLYIWNSIFFPLIRESDHDYVLMWYSDAIPPPNVIEEYLKVAENYPAGWVGGSLARREPRLMHMRSNVESPWPMELVNANNPVRCKLTGHIWLMPREACADCTLYLHPPEIHISIINCMEEKEMYVYYQPSVYLQHVSTDGKIHHPEMPWK